MSLKPPPPPTDETFTKRGRVLHELVETEITFVKNLQTLITSYIETIRVGDTDIKKSVLANSSIAVLFSNIEQIHAVNVDLLERLKLRIKNQENKNSPGKINNNRNSPTTTTHRPPLPSHSPPPLLNALDDQTPLIGDIFLQFAPRFKLYAQYTATHDKASKVFHKLRDNVEFQNLLEQILVDRANRGSNKNVPQQNMESFLIMPVQRVPRYKLLLKEIHKYTPENHSDRTTLVEALNAVDSTAHLINETIRQREEFDRLVFLESQFTSGKVSLAKYGRRLIKEGKLTKRGRKTTQEYHFHLFNDILLYSKSHNAQNTSFTLHRRIDLAYTNVGTEILGNLEGAFSIMSKEKSFVVYAENDVEKDIWVSKLKESILEIQSQHMKEQLRSESLRTNTILKQKDGSSKRVQGRRISTMDIVTQANVWVPDDSHHLCMTCGVNFTLVRRRHHCRKCGSLVCDSCSPHRLFLPNVDTVPVRVCNTCANSIKEDEMEALRLELHILSVELQDDLDGVSNNDNNSSANVNKSLQKNKSSSSIFSNIFSSASSTGSIGSGSSTSSSSSNSNWFHGIGRYAKIYLNDQLHGQTETTYYDKASGRFPFGSKGVYFDIGIPRIALGIDEAGREITIFIEIYQTVKNSLSKDVLIGTSQLNPFEVLMVTNSLRETKDGAMASKERQDGVAQFHYDVLERWQARQFKKNNSFKLNKNASASSNYSNSAHSFNSMTDLDFSNSNFGLETINPLLILEQRKRAVQVFPSSGVSTLPMVRERGLNDDGNNIHYGLHTKDDIEMCGEVHVSFGLIVPSNLEKLNTVIETEQWLSKVVDEYYIRSTGAKKKMREQNHGDNTSNAGDDGENKDITLLTIDRVADVQMMQLLIKYCIQKCEKIQSTDIESDDDDEDSSLQEISTAKDIECLGNNIAKLRVGRNTSSADIIQLLSKLKETFEADSDTVACLPLLENYREKMQNRKTMSMGNDDNSVVVNGNKSTSRLRGKSLVLSKDITPDKLKTRDDYIYMILLSEEEYVKTLDSIIERIINPSLAHHSGANVSAHHDNGSSGRRRGQSLSAPKYKRSVTADLDNGSNEIEKSKQEVETKAVIALNALKQIVTLHETILNALIKIIDDGGIALSVSFDMGGNRKGSVTSRHNNRGSAGNGDGSSHNQGNSNNVMVGKLFNDFGSSFKMYSEFANNFEYMIRYFKNTKAINKIIKKYRLYLFVDVGMFEAKNEDIVLDKIEMPLQRLDQYTSLISGLIEITPETHRDSKNLKLALQQLEKVNHHIQVSNDVRINKEELFRMENSIIMDDGSHISLVTKDRKFIRCGPLIKVCRRVNKEFYFWLLSDQLIYGHYIGSGKFRFHRSLSLSSCNVVDIDDGERNKAASTATSSKKGRTKGSLLKRVQSIREAATNQNSKPSDPKTHRFSFTIQSNLKSFVAIVPSQYSSKYGLIPRKIRTSGDTEDANDIAHAEGTSIEIGKAWTRDLQNAITQFKQTKRTTMDVDNGIKRGISIGNDGKMGSFDDDYDEEEDNFIAPVWKPDAASKNCLICDKPFKYIIRMRHHCRKCGILCCDACSPYRELIATIDNKRSVRICANCHEDPVLLV